jgi:hypothetical protein
VNRLCPYINVSAQILSSGFLAPMIRSEPKVSLANLNYSEMALSSEWAP